MPRLNEVRARLGLAPIGSFSPISSSEPLASSCSRAGSSTSPPPYRPNVRYVGAQLEEPEWTPPWESPWPADDPRPLVVVGLTTTYQAHDGLLKRTVEALGGLPVRALVSTGRIAVGNAPPIVQERAGGPAERRFGSHDPTGRSRPSWAPARA